ncbi:MAG: PRD domain-containing protein [Ligilactobacillus salivarius]|nr:PRD domain-containing protein [Ligilactobacillus salivarius]
MKLIKKINNNFVLAEDSAGNQVIVEGKGIGFTTMPCTITDLSCISRTYYDYDEKYLSLIADIPQDVIDVSILIYKKLISSVDCTVNDSLPFVLADHINFSIERHKKGMDVQLPLYYDLQQMYPLEYEVAEYGLKVIEKNLNIKLPHDEVSGIMLNMINAEINKDKIIQAKENGKRNTKITDIIEQELHISISRDSFNYSRFITHMNYLYNRARNNDMHESENQKMYNSMITKYPDINVCVEKISKYLNDEYLINLNDEEKLYLMLHINRLCSRELGL